MLPPPNPPASGTANSSTITGTSSTNNTTHTTHSVGSSQSGPGSVSTQSGAGGSFPTRPSLPARSGASSASTSTQTSYNSNSSSSLSLAGTPSTSSGLFSASTSGQWVQASGTSASGSSWAGSGGLIGVGVGGGEGEGEYDPSATAGPSRRGDGGSQASEGYGHCKQITGGTFAGKMMRFSLTMAQQPIHGRRKTEKDRRPLAHCPILRLKMLECTQRADGSGVIDEDEVDVVTLEPGNFVCAAELCDVVTNPAPVKDQTHGPSRPDPPRYSASVRNSPSSRHRRNSAGDDTGGDTTMRESTATSTSPPRPGQLLRPSSWAADGPPGVTGTVVQTQYIKGPSLDRLAQSNPSPSGSSSATATPMHPDAQHEAVRAGDDIELDTPQEEQGGGALLAGQTRTAGDRSSGSSGSGSADSVTAKPQPKRAKHPDGDEATPVTTGNFDNTAPRNLYGSLHVPAVRVISPEGDFGLWFLFTDLTVRQEGTYALKFRVFDITAASKTSAAPILVSTNSQAFKVYSPRNFPGLPKPTELAEHFGRQGFKLNTRKNERQAKSPPASPPARPEPKPIQSPSDTPVRVTSSEKDSKKSTDRSRSPARPGTANTASTLAGTSGTSGSGSGGSSMSGSGRGRGVAPSPLSRSFGSAERRNK